MTIKVNRAVLGHRVLTGVSRRHLANVVVELATPWQAVVEGRRDASRGGARQRA
ncbi:IS5/IS1182 family transposase, partial [Kitasatospora sp. NPDC056138]